jgi:hypothetical protein
MTTIDPNKHIQRQRTKDEIRQALSDMCHRKPTMHVPPQVEDTDVILYDAFKELLELRTQVQKVQELEAKSQRIDTAVQTMIDNLMGCREQVL